MTTAPVASAVLAAAESQMGVKYAWGGEAPGKGFDCSGLTQWAFGTVGIKLPRTSQEQAAVASPLKAADVKPGDLVFSAGSDGTASSPGHVGIYVGSDKYIDAPYTGQSIRIDPVPVNATFGRVSGLTSDLTSAGIPVSAGGTSSPSSPGACSNSGGADILGVHIGTGCQTKALVGGLLVGLGGFVMLGGALLVASKGLASTSLGRQAKAAAKFVPGPVGVASRVIGK